MAVANKYFVDETLTIAELVPLPLDKGRPVAASGDAHVR